MNCLWCGSAKMRVSRLQISDINQLFLFRYPVRCRACFERDHVPFLRAWRLGRLSKRRARSNDAAIGIGEQAVRVKPPIHKAGAQTLL